MAEGQRFLNHLHSSMYVCTVKISVTRLPLFDCNVAKLSDCDYNFHISLIAARW